MYWLVCANSNPHGAIPSFAAPFRFHSILRVIDSLAHFENFNYASRILYQYTGKSDCNWSGTLNSKTTKVLLILVSWLQQWFFYNNPVINSRTPFRLCTSPPRRATSRSCGCCVWRERLFRGKLLWVVIFRALGKCKNHRSDWKLQWFENNWLVTTVRQAPCFACSSHGDHNPR